MISATGPGVRHATKPSNGVEPPDPERRRTSWNEGLATSNTSRKIWFGGGSYYNYVLL